MNEPHCEIVHDDQGQPIARVQLAGEPTDEEREAIAEVIRAVQRMTPEQIAETSERARKRRQSEHP